MLSGDIFNTKDENVDPSFDLDSILKSDSDHIIDNFCEEWVSHLNHEDSVLLGLGSVKEKWQSWLD